jgi:hypothetical protein
MVLCFWTAGVCSKQLSHLMLLNHQPNHKLLTNTGFNNVLLHSELSISSAFISTTNHISRYFWMQKPQPIRPVWPILVSFWMTPLRLCCQLSPLCAFFSCGSNSSRYLQMFGGSVDTGKASHLYAVLHESANNNPHTRMSMFHIVIDYSVSFHLHQMQRIAFNWGLPPTAQCSYSQCSSNGWLKVKTWDMKS